MLLIILGLMAPFLGTTLGAAMVYFLKNDVNLKLKKIFLGFAAGVMIASSIWSLIIPSLEKSLLLTTLGITLGIIVFTILDKVTNTIENKKSMVSLAVTLHNIPEGLAVGVVYANAIYQNNSALLIGAFVFAIGIAIQNFPEGSIISLPLKANGYSNNKAFMRGLFSGIVEPIASVLAIILTRFIVPVMPLFLSFAAGAMFYVVIAELIPETGKSNYKTFGFLFGFLLMMVLDVILG